jgi:hypothetical protein
MRCLVVCGFGVTILILLPMMVLISVDLPTFGRPTTATNPQRKESLFTACGVLSILVHDEFEHVAGSFLLGVAPCCAQAPGLLVKLCNFTADVEDLFVCLAAGLLQLILGQGKRTALQPLLQSRFGIPRGRSIRNIAKPATISFEYNLGRSIHAPVQVDRAENCLQRIGQYRTTPEAARFFFSRTENQVFAEFEFERDCGQRRVFD